MPEGLSNPPASDPPRRPATDARIYVIRCAVLENKGFMKAGPIGPQPGPMGRSFPHPRRRIPMHSLALPPDPLSRPAPAGPPYPHRPASGPPVGPERANTCKTLGCTCGGATAPMGAGA